jgi:hypothetical protein
MSLAAEFGEFGADDESVTGLKAAAKNKKEKKKKKKKSARAWRKHFVR